MPFYKARKKQQSQLRKEKVMILENDWILLSFDQECNNIVELINKKTSDNYIKSIPDEPVFKLVALDKANNKIECLPEKPNSVKTEENKIVARYDTLKAEGRTADINCEITISLDGQDVKVSLKLNNNDTSLDVVETVCPMVKGIYLGDSYQDDYIIYPHHAGERTKNPIKEYTSERYLTFPRAGTVQKNNYYVREINYCGLASMTWMYYYDENNGLYIGSHDDRFPVTGIIAVTGGVKDPWMGFGFRKYYRIGYKESFETKTYYISVSCEDWHWGAHKYRNWIQDYLEFNNNPEFLKDECALNQCYNFKKDGHLFHKFKDIPQLFDRGMEYGVRHMFVASWNRLGFDTNYPEYYPDMELGTAEDICRGIDYVNKHGGFATFYINSRIFDIESDFYESVGKKMAITDNHQNILTESYGPRSFSLNCPSDEQWHKQLVDTAVFTMKSYGLKGIYLDQLGSANAYPCYHEGHSHKNIGEFNNGYVSILKELKQKLKEIDPDAFLMIENCGDIYGSYTWGNLTWNGSFYDEYYNVFKYTFPEYVQVNMVNPRSWVKDPELQEVWYYKDMQRAILLGSILWLGLTTRFSDKNKDQEIYARKMIALRKRINPFIKECCYKDNLYLKNKPENIEVSVWESDSKVMILLGNSECSCGEVSFKMPFEFKVSEYFNEDEDDKNIVVDKNGKELTVKVNTNRLFAVILQK